MRRTVLLVLLAVLLAALLVRGEVEEQDYSEDGEDEERNLRRRGAKKLFSKAKAVFKKVINAVSPPPPPAVVDPFPESEFRVLKWGKGNLYVIPIETQKLLDATRILTAFSPGVEDNSKMFRHPIPELYNFDNRPVHIPDNAQHAGIRLTPESTYREELIGFFFPYTWEQMYDAVLHDGEAFIEYHKSHHGPVNASFCERSEDLFGRSSGFGCPGPAFAAAVQGVTTLRFPKGKRKDVGCTGNCVKDVQQLIWHAVHVATNKALLNLVVRVCKSTKFSGATRNDRITGTKQMVLDPETFRPLGWVPVNPQDKTDVCDKIQQILKSKLTNAAGLLTNEQIPCVLERYKSFIQLPRGWFSLRTRNQIVENWWRLQSNAATDNIIWLNNQTKITLDKECPKPQTTQRLDGSGPTPTATRRLNAAAKTAPKTNLLQSAVAVVKAGFAQIFSTAGAGAKTPTSTKPGGPKMPTKPRWSNRYERELRRQPRGRAPGSKPASAARRSKRSVSKPASAPRRSKRSVSKPASAPRRSKRSVSKPARKPQTKAARRVRRQCDKSTEFSVQFTLKLSANLVAILTDDLVGTKDGVATVVRDALAGLCSEIQTSAGVLVNTGFLGYKAASEFVKSLQHFDYKKAGATVDKGSTGQFCDNCVLRGVKGNFYSVYEQSSPRKLAEALNTVGGVYTNSIASSYGTWDAPPVPPLSAQKNAFSSIMTNMEAACYEARYPNVRAAVDEVAARKNVSRSSSSAVDIDALNKILRRRSRYDWIAFGQVEKRNKDCLKLTDSAVDCIVTRNNAIIGNDIARRCSQNEESTFGGTAVGDTGQKMGNVRLEGNCLTDRKWYNRAIQVISVYDLKGSVPKLDIGGCIKSNETFTSGPSTAPSPAPVAVPAPGSGNRTSTAPSPAPVAVPAAGSGNKGKNSAPPQRRSVSPVASAPTAVGASTTANSAPTQQGPRVRTASPMASAPTAAGASTTANSAPSQQRPRVRTTPAPSVPLFIPCRTNCPTRPAFPQQCGFFQTCGNGCFCGTAPGVPSPFPTRQPTVNLFFSVTAAPSTAMASAPAPASRGSRPQTQPPTLAPATASGSSPGHSVATQHQSSSPSAAPSQSGQGDLGVGAGSGGGGGGGGSSSGGEHQEQQAQSNSNGAASSGSSQLGAGTIAGIAVGAVAAIGLVVAAVVFMARSKASSSDESPLSRFSYGSKLSFDHTQIYGGGGGTRSRRSQAEMANIPSRPPLNAITSTAARESFVARGPQHVRASQQYSTRASHSRPSFSPGPSLDPRASLSRGLPERESSGDSARSDPHRIQL